MLVDPGRGVAGWKGLSRSFVHDVQGVGNLRKLLLNGVQQVIERVWTLMLDAVDEKRWRPVHVTVSSALDNSEEWREGRISRWVGHDWLLLNDLLHSTRSRTTG